MTETTTPETISTAFAKGQTQIAMMFAAQCQGQVLHVTGQGWMFWDGRRWAEDIGNKRTRRTLLAMLSDIAPRALNDSELVKLLSQTYRSASYQNGALEIAAALPELCAEPEDMDARPWSLNVANGILDLDTLELTPHDPAELHTKVTAGGWNPGATSDVWTPFLAKILPDEAVRGYVQRFAGLSLIGEVREHILAIATGTGANGKGTFYEALAHAMGDYSHQAESELFMASKNNANAASPAKMGLKGARFVVCSETEDGHAIASALMKNLTGGDAVTARPLYGHPVTFQPSHTALMVTNHLPVVRGDDPAIWRRLRVVPFDVVIPEDERDGTLPRTLRGHADAILTWAVLGLQAYRERGMDTPDAVDGATAAYHNASDVTGRFLAEECESGPDRYVATDALYAEYGRWSAENGEEVSSKAEFLAYLKRKGYEHVRRYVEGKRSRYIKGLKIVSTH